MKEYLVERKTGWTASVDDQILRETTDTRCVLRAELVENSRDKGQSVRATLLHQKRHSRADSWQDVGSFNLRALKAGEDVRLILDSEATEKLFNGLQDLYRIHQEKGIPTTVGHYAVIDLSELSGVTQRGRETAQQALKQYGPKLWDYIGELQPDLVRSVFLRNEHVTREAAVHEFEQHVQFGDWSEPDWQTFFTRNVWIFGHNLSFRFLDLVTDRPQYAPPDVFRQEGQQGDYLMASAAVKRFTVLVEIKRPDSPLLLAKKYRNRVYPPSEELVSGVAQLQSHCNTWEVEGAQSKGNIQKMAETATSTYKPRGYLVIGHTGELDAADKVASFELFRQHLGNPEVITFDELLARARHTALMDTPNGSGAEGVKQDG